MLGEGMSEHLPLLGGLRPCSFPPFSEGVCAGLAFTEPLPHSESDTTALALALSFSFSRSVWLTGPGLGIPRPAPLLEPVPEPSPEAGSLSLEPWGAVEEGFTGAEPASMVVLIGRAELGRVRVNALVLAGRGKDRYWRDVLAFGDRKPLWSVFGTSRLVLRPLPPPPAPGLTGIPDVLGIFPTVAEPQGMELPPVLITVGILTVLALLLVAGLGFLKPKFPPVDGLTRPDGGLRWSPAPRPFLWSFPASEEERWRPEAFTANRDLSTSLLSVFTVPGRLAEAKGGKMSWMNSLKSSKQTEQWVSEWDLTVVSYLTTYMVWLSADYNTSLSEQTV